MKIYVVTTGSYSDYSINSLFLDKEKALKYIELLSQIQYSDVNDLEEFETSDDIVEFSRLEEVDHCGWVIKTNEIKHFYDRKYIVSHQLPNYHLSKSRYDVKDFDSVGIDVPKGKYTDEQIRKMCQDKYAEFKSLMDNESWTVEMINERFYKFL